MGERAWLDHIAIAVSNPEKLKRVLSLLGAIDMGLEQVKSQSVITHFLMTAEATPALEILEPMPPDSAPDGSPNGVSHAPSAVAKFIAKKGAGIHHFCVGVKNISEMSRFLRAEGVRLTYSEAQSGAHGALVNFIHPESTGGILIEISQKGA